MKKLIAVAAIAMAGLWAVPACATPAPAHARQSSAKAQTAFKTKPKAGTKARCPVMKHSFTVSANTAWSKYKGRYYVFCCPGCKPKFDKNPSQYAGS